MIINTYHVSLDIHFYLTYLFFGQYNLTLYNVASVITSGPDWIYLLRSESNLIVYQSEREINSFINSAGIITLQITNRYDRGLQMKSERY